MNIFTKLFDDGSSKNSTRFLDICRFSILHPGYSLFLIFFMLLFSGILGYGQAIPRVPGSPYPYSTIPDKLYLVEDNRDVAQRVALQTLMGVIAQEKPEILIDTFGHLEFVEKAGIPVDRTYYNDFSGLLQNFASRLSGYFLCNTMDASTNVAISLAGIEGGIAIPVEIEQIAIDAGLTQILDVRERDESWLFDNYGDQFNKKLGSFHSSVDNRVIYLGDFSTFSKAAQFWDTSATGPVAAKGYANLDSGATVLGWGPGEYDTVEQLSLNGMSIIPADFAPNLSTLMNITPTRKEFKQKEPIKPYKVEENVHTVCFVISDGDNLQWLLGAHNNTNNWNSPLRGKVDLGWTISPSLVDMAPTIYEKYLDNCLTTPAGRNLLIAGPSGKSYYMPHRMPDEALEKENLLLNEYMKRADLGIVNIIDTDDSDYDPEPYLKHENIDALFSYSYGGNYRLRNGQIDWYKDKPSIGGRYTLWGTLSSPDFLANLLNSGSTDITSQDGYSLVSVHVWTRDVDDVIETTKLLNPNVRVVSPDEFVWLIKKNIKGLPMGNGMGLKGEYYSDINFETLQITKTDAEVNFDWNTGSPDETLLGNDQFSIRWSGQVQPLYTEEYTFYVRSDDGAKLTVNGEVLIDELANNGLDERSGTINLTAGEKYDIVLEYVENTENASCQLRWESNSQLKTIVPKTQLYSQIQNSTTGPVTLYAECDYENTSVGLTLGEYDLEHLNFLGILDNSISSLTVQPGFKVILFDEDNFEGNFIELTSDTPCLIDRFWDDVTSSIRIIADGETDLSGVYTFINSNSGNLVLDVAGGPGNTRNAANVQIWDDSNTANQLFALKHLENGLYTITALHSDKVLEVENFSLEDNANVTQNENLETNNQKFIAIRNEDGIYQFIAASSGQVLAVEDEGVTAESNVVQKNDRTLSSSFWELRKIEPVAGTGAGLVGNYYNGFDFTSFVTTRIDPVIDFNWGSGSPADGIDIDNFSIRWQGEIEAPYSGLYTFYITSDNGRRVWIDNELIIDEWQDDFNIEYSGNFLMEAGKKYDIKVMYYEKVGGADCTLEWSGPLTEKQIIPSSQLYPDIVPDTYEQSFVSWESFNIIGHYIRHRDSRARIDRSRNIGVKGDQQWVMVSGLAGSGISFQSVNFSDRYLSNIDGELVLTAGDGSQSFNESATFVIESGLADPSKVSFRSFTNPEQYIRHRDFLLYVEPISSDLDRADATFVPFVTPLVTSWNSHNIPEAKIRHQDGNGRLDIDVTPVEDAQWNMVYGLAGMGRSFQSVNFPNVYLRQVNGEIKAVALNENDENFRTEATFYIREGIADPAKQSFESLAVPGNFIRHRNSLLFSEQIVTEEDQADATFFINESTNTLDREDFEYQRNAFTLYPNPVKDNLIISGKLSKSTTFEIFNILGKHIATHQVQSNAQQYTIDTAALKTGVYFIRTAEYIEKFVKN